MAGVFEEEPRHAEIRDLGVQLLVEEHVACLDVPVDDLHRGFFVEVKEAPC